MEPHQKKQLRQLGLRVTLFFFALTASILFLVACIRETGTHPYVTYQEGVGATAFGATASLLSLTATVVNTFRMPCSRFCPIVYLNAGLDFFGFVLLLAGVGFNAMFDVNNNFGDLKNRRLTCTKNEVIIGFQSMKQCIIYEKGSAMMEVGGTVVMFLCAILHIVAFACSVRRWKKMRKLRAEVMEGKEAPDSADSSRTNSAVDHSIDKLSSRTDSV